MKKTAFLIRLSLALWGLTIILLCLVFLGYYGSLPETAPLRNKLRLGKVLKYIDISPYFFSYLDSSLPIYDVIVKKEDYDKILQARPKSSILTKKHKTYVPAKFFFKGKKYKIKLRLRGLTSNHWRDEKKSWRIRFSKKNLFNGKRDINLILPEDRGYIAEQLSNFIAKKLGLMTPESKFALLRINKEFLGLYFEIEQIEGNQFIEKNKRFKKANLYNEEDWDWSKYGLTPLFSKVGHWKKKSTEKRSSHNNFAEVDKLLTLLHEPDDTLFLKKVSHLIDIKQFLTWQSHSVIMGSDHQTHHANNNVYFNASKGTFEFIPWDVHQWPIQRRFFDTPYHPIVTRILRHPPFLHERNKILGSYIYDSKNLNKALNYYDTTYEKIRSAFHADTLKGYSNIRLRKKIKFHRNVFIKNQKKIKDNLAFSKVFLNIRYDSKNMQRPLILETTVHGMSSALLRSLILPSKHKQHTRLYLDQNGDGKFQKNSDLQITFTETPNDKNTRLHIDKILFSKYNEKLKPIQNTYTFFLHSDQTLRPNDIDFEFENAINHDAIQPTVRFIDNYQFAHFEDIFLSVAQLIKRFPFLQKVGDHQVTFKSGIWHIRETLIIPPQVQLSIHPKTKLIFSKGTSLISYGKILAIGSAQAPIIITARSKKKHRGTFAIIGDKANHSIFKNVHFEYGGEASENGIFFSGGLAVHFVPNVTISHCRFQSNTGDDALNIKNGKADITHSTFLNNASDAIDLDFMSGNISHNTFDANGGDAIDLGTSSPLITFNVIKNTKDKAISVGEGSKSVMHHNKLIGNEIGIAIKDASSIQADKMTFSDNRFAIQTYVKKFIYESPKPSFLKNSTFLGNDHNFKIIDGEIQLKNCMIDGQLKNDVIIKTPQPS